MQSDEKTLLLDDIRRYRKSRDLTQAEVAEYLGMSRATYNSAESGQRLFKRNELQTLATIFELPVNTFINHSSVQTENSVNIVKYKQVLMRCLEKAGDPKDYKIPKTKLAKLIYLVDYVYFYKHAEPVTGAQYRRIPYGPVPDIFFTTVDELFEDGSLVLEINGNTQLLSPNEHFSDDLLGDDEKVLIDEICIKWQPRSTGEIVEFTHEQLPWKTCRSREIIPYELIIQEEPTNLF